MEIAVMMRKTGYLIRLKFVLPNRIDIDDGAMVFPLKTKKE